MSNVNVINLRTPVIDAEEVLDAFSDGITATAELMLQDASKDVLTLLTLCDEAHTYRRAL